MSIIQATNITKSFSSLRVLKGVTLSIEKSEIVSIVGASGAGKSTLLQIMGTLLPLEKGSSLYIDGIDVAKLKDRAISRLRNEKIGFIFQSHGLLPEFSSLENVMLPALIKGDNKSIAKARAKELLSLLGMSDREAHQPSQLSGGECQRVSIARALINSPSVILADEPTGSLDSQNRESLHNIFFDLRERLLQTFVIVTHDETFASLCDRMVCLKDGKIDEIIQKTSTTHY